MSKCVTMYGENKPSTLINDDHERPNFFRAIPVRAPRKMAMPKNVTYVILSGLSDRSQDSLVSWHRTSDGTLSPVNPKFHRVLATAIDIRKDAKSSSGPGRSAQELAESSGSATSYYLLDGRGDS